MRLAAHYITTLPTTARKRARTVFKTPGSGEEWLAGRCSGSPINKNHSLPSELHAAPHHGPAQLSITPSTLETMPPAAHQLVWVAGAETLVINKCCRSPSLWGWPNGLLLRECDHISLRSVWCRMNTGHLSTFLATVYIDLLPHELSLAVTQDAGGPSPRHLG